MPIQVTCQCGKKLSVPDDRAGRPGKCPACGSIVQTGAAQPAAPAAAQPLPAQPVAPAPPPPIAAPPIAPPPPLGAPLQYAAPGRAPTGPIAPPPAYLIRTPTSLPEKLRQPGQPPCFLAFNTQGADVNVEFDPAPVLEAFAESLAKKLKKKHDVQLLPPAPGAAPPPGSAHVFVRLIQMDEGSRWMRYFLGIFFGGTKLEIDGQVTGPSGQPAPFNLKYRGRGGLFGGSSLNLLKMSARILAGKVAKRVRKAA